MMIQYHSRFNLLLPLIDLLILLFSAWFVHYAYLADWMMPAAYQRALLLASVLYLWLSSVFNVYRAWRGQGLLPEIKKICLTLALVFAILVFFWFTLKIGAAYSRLWLFLWFTLSAVCLFVFRFVLRLSLKKMRKKGKNLRHIIIVGEGGWANEVSSNIKNAPELGFNVVLKSIDLIAIQQCLNSKHIHQLWLAMSIADSHKINHLLSELGDSSIDICWLPDTSSFQLINHSVSHIGQMPVINISSSPMVGFGAFVKNIVDKVFSFFVLLMLSPVMILIAILIKCGSTGPVIFKQTRYGLNGQSISVYKFRSMTTTDNDNDIVQASKTDQRITKLGAFLRRTSLDELPQFFNVLQGKMSVVGPRPHAKAHNEKYRKLVPLYMQRHLVKPGITGWAQINGWRGETETLVKMEKRIEYDLYYINNWSFWFDIKIIFLTVDKIFKDDNAY